MILLAVGKIYLDQLKETKMKKKFFLFIGFLLFLTASGAAGHVAPRVFFCEDQAPV